MSIYRVIVCGARDWTDRDIIADTLRGIGLQAAKRGALLEIVHGDSTGADRIAGEIGEQIGARVHPMPAEWESFGRAAGPIRNRAMPGFPPKRSLLGEKAGQRQLRPQLVIAFHDAIHRSKGTADMVRAAARSGVPFLVISHAETTGQPSLM